MACQQLERIVFPTSLRTLGRFAFAGCAALQSVAFAGGPVALQPDSIGDLDVEVSGYLIEFGTIDGSTITACWESSLYRAIGGGLLSKVKTYVQRGQGWDSIVASGTWQGCPIKYADGGDDPEEEDGGFTGEKAMTFNGLVKDSDGALCGIAQITTAKATAKGVKVSGFVMLSDGKKQTLKAVAVPIENGQLNVETKIGKTEVSLTITGDGFSGTFGDLSLASADVGEDTGILSGTLKMSYFDAKTGKIKTKSIKLTGVASEGEAVGELTVKGEETKTFAVEVE